MNSYKKLQTYGYLVWDDGTKMDCHGNEILCNGKVYKPEAILAFAKQGRRVVDLNNGSMLEDECCWGFMLEGYGEISADNAEQANMVIHAMLFMFNLLSSLDFDANRMESFLR